MFTHFHSRILLETDGPYFRIGQAKDCKSSSHPGHVVYVALRVAQLRGEDWVTIMEATQKNTKGRTVHI